MEITYNILKLEKKIKVGKMTEIIEEFNSEAEIMSSIVKDIDIMRRKVEIIKLIT
jgi:hypothetical protein